MRRFLKSVVPAPAWSHAKNAYNRARYNLLWKRRTIVEFNKNGHQIRLVIVDPNDLIQSEQKRGKFYEEEELDTIAAYFPEGGTFVDVGANTGQHSLYFAKLKAAHVVMVEPGPEAFRLMLQNIELNNIQNECSILQVGFSDANGRADIEVHLDNLGSASISENSRGEITTVRGDDVLIGRKIDMIKIDTEGFEIKVLAGLTETIDREQPIIYIEIDNKNLDCFHEFMRAVRYEVVYRNKRYEQNENFLISPSSRHSKSG